MYYLQYNLLISYSHYFADIKEVFAINLLASFSIFFYQGDNSEWILTSNFCSLQIRYCIQFKPQNIVFEASSYIENVISNYYNFIFTEYFHWSCTGNCWKSSYQHLNEYSGYLWMFILGIVFEVFQSSII